jgi:hypothetical protein
VTASLVINELFDPPPQFRIDRRLFRFLHCHREYRNPGGMTNDECRNDEFLMTNKACKRSFAACCGLGYC